jgi:hypothetical protein
MFAKLRGNMFQEAAERRHKTWAMERDLPDSPRQSPAGIHDAVVRGDPPPERERPAAVEVRSADLLRDIRDPELVAVEAVLAKRTEDRTHDDLALVLRRVETIPDIDQLAGSPEERLDFCRGLQLERYAADQMLCSQGMPSLGRRVLLLRGVLRVSIDGTDRLWLRPGASYGGGESTKPWAATVYADMGAVSIAFWIDPDAEKDDRKPRTPATPSVGPVVGATAAGMGSAMAGWGSVDESPQGHPASGKRSTSGPWLGIKKHTDGRRRDQLPWEEGKQQVAVQRPPLLLLTEYTQRQGGLGATMTWHPEQHFQRVWTPKVHRPPRELPSSLGAHLKTVLHPRPPGSARAVSQSKRGGSSTSVSSDYQVRQCVLRIPLKTAEKPLGCYVCRAPDA